MTKVHPQGFFIPGDNPNGLQSLHLDTLIQSPTKVIWVERWSKVQATSFIGPTMWVSPIKD
jgi:hypothetical protein